jgi:hypothetical protein
MLTSTRNIRYGDDTGWKIGNRLSTLNFGPHKFSLSTYSSEYQLCTELFSYLGVSLTQNLTS